VRAASVVRDPHDGADVLLDRVVVSKVPEFFDVLVVSDCAEPDCFRSDFEQWHDRVEEVSDELEVGGLDRG